VLDEALSNAVRHAGPTTVSVRVSRTDDRLELTVRDDGAGFVAAREDGVGLTSMRERCEELGGQFDLSTTPAGTTVRATFPIR
jgi:signal transduction histidine kinase